jgi:two-component system OmpR family response regulator
MTVKKTLRRRKPARKRSHLNPHHRILVVDDDEDFRSLNAEVLTNSGYQVDTAADGALAWDSLQINRYDLLLTDYGMPKVNGLDLIKKLRAAQIAVPVILVSGTVPKEELRYLRLHIDATLPKPYTLDESLASVRKALCAIDNLPGGARHSRLYSDSRPSEHFQTFSKRKPTLK